MGQTFKLFNFNLRLSLALVLLISVSAQGSEISDALAKRNQAQSDYYTELKKLGRNATPEQRDEVRARTVLSATFDLVDAVRRTEIEKSKETRRAIHNSFQATFKGQEIPKWVTDPRAKMPQGDGKGAKSKKSDDSSRETKGQKNKGKESTLPQSKPSGTPVDKQRPTSTRESITLDGSKVPKEIEFNKSDTSIEEKTVEFPVRDTKGLDSSKIPSEIEFNKGE